jgi:hypothetical protein
VNEEKNFGNGQLRCQTAVSQFGGAFKTVREKEMSFLCFKKQRDDKACILQV